MYKVQNDSITVLLDVDDEDKAIKFLRKSNFKGKSVLLKNGEKIATHYGFHAKKGVFKK